MHPLTYTETSIDYHLCTHPKYKYTKESHIGSSIPLTQKQFLHHMVMPSPLAGRAGPGLQGRAGNRDGGTPGIETKRACSHSCGTRKPTAVALCTLVPTALRGPGGDPTPLRPPPDPPLRLQVAPFQHPTFFFP